MRPEVHLGVFRLYRMGAEMRAGMASSLALR